MKLYWKETSKIPFLKKWSFNGKLWEKHLWIWILKKLEKLAKENSSFILTFGVLLFQKNNSYRFLISLTWMGTEKSHIKIFKYLSALKCFPPRVYISDKISLNSQKFNVVNMSNVFNQQSSINIIAYCIKRCMQT